jgi:hypothetical protein
VYELQLPGPENPDQEIKLWPGSTIRITNQGDGEPFCIVKHLGQGRTRISFFGPDEYFTAADLELLREEVADVGVSAGTYA